MLLTPTFIPLGARLWLCETTLFMHEDLTWQLAILSLNAHAKHPICDCDTDSALDLHQNWFPSNTWGLQNYSNYAVSITAYNCGYRWGDHNNSAWNLLHVRCGQHYEPSCSPLSFPVDNCIHCVACTSVSRDAPTEPVFTVSCPHGHRQTNYKVRKSDLEFEQEFELQIGQNKGEEGRNSIAK